MTKFAAEVAAALDDWEDRTQLSLGKSIRELLGQIEDLEDQILETDECVAGMKEGFAQRIQAAEEETEKLRAFANKYLGFTTAGVMESCYSACPKLLAEARELGLNIPQRYLGVDSAIEN